MSTTTWTIRMELLSDTLFGSGLSLSGGADLSAKRDGSGFPYVSGATFKGLLRESMEDLLCWSGADHTLADILLGQAGYAGLESPRRVKLTALTLVNPPADPAACYQERTFTALEQGVVKSASLRSASCVARGQVFEGLLSCQEADSELLIQAVENIRYVGTHRSRGLGHVRCSAVPAAVRQAPVRHIAPAPVIRYQLHNLLPVVVTDLSGERLQYAAGKCSPEEAKKAGCELIYCNTSELADPTAALLELSEGGFDDVMVMVPVAELLTMAERIAGFDGCINFFAGPAVHELPGSLNLYRVHYDGIHLVGTAGSIPEDTVETISLIEQGSINPGVMVSHILGLDAVPEAILAMAHPGGAKKVCYNGLDIPMVALSDFAELGKTDPLWARLDEIVKANGGTWCAEAEQYLLANAPRRKD